MGSVYGLVPLVWMHACQVRVGVVVLHAGGRQKDFVETEKTLGRTDPAQISALVGYAGGQVRCAVNH